jgi:hypothetical protein
LSSADIAVARVAERVRRGAPFGPGGRCSAALRVRSQEPFRRIRQRSRYVADLR